MQEWICTHECFQFSTHLFIGDVIQGEENPGHHFTLLVGIERFLSPTGRKFLDEGGRITGVWDV
jgi:hypothetical protein